MTIPPSCAVPNALRFKFNLSSPSCTGDDAMAICWEEMEITRMRRRMMKEARRSMPELGYGRVMYLVRAFERLLSLSQQIKTAGVGAGKKKGMLTLTTMDVTDWALFQPPEEISSEEDYDYPIFPEFESHEANFAARFNFASVGESDAAQRKTDLSKKRWIKKLKVRKQKPFKKRTGRGGLKEEQSKYKIRELLLLELKDLIHSYIQVSEMKLYFLKRSRMASGLVRIHSNWRLKLSGVLSQCSFDRDHNILPPGALATADDEKNNSVQLDEQVNSVQPDLNTTLVSCKEDLSDELNNASSRTPESNHAAPLCKSNKWINYIKGRYHRFVSKLSKTKFKPSRWCCCCTCGKDRYK